MLSSLARGLGRTGSSLLAKSRSDPASRPLLRSTNVDADGDDNDIDTEAGGRMSGYFTRRPHDDNHFDIHEDEEEGEEVVQDEDEEDEENEPLLPLFSAAHLDALPVFSLTHNIRLLIDQKCETTLSWEQLRSPQISQFLVKPIQNDIRHSHFSRATLYALLANCLQFKKEGQANPGIVGVCNTRALLAELLAVRLLKEYSTRELIDALSYDFDPLSGIPVEMSPHRQHIKNSQRRLVGRTSTLEVAIRAEAKKFISHPLVVQQLESIWAGAIVFHSAADSLHRYPARPRITHGRHYGATFISGMSRESIIPAEPAPSEPIRRSVTLYDPSDASPFKLSRLRVPRYRHIASTLTYGVMLCLFISVLSDRSLTVTPLEVIFWFWSVGYMLDEIVGFSEQGFGLYIASVWNAFDIGILTLFSLYYVLRISGAIVTASYKERMANMAYDVLAASAVLLLPRFFSILDHFRYFSQLLIAFRLMFRDLAAVLVLIIISCSGFFVAFTLAFGQEDFDGRGVVYALFQILMGFTPAAWDVWSDFNLLGKCIMAMFLIITHFLVVTILISVLTNSFMAVVKNANEEHQYLFAINTISAVKSDALFSYVAPVNLLGFLLAPLRYSIPFPKYVLVNRTAIKATHFPVLFCIWTYERVWLAKSGSEPVDHVERRGRTLKRMPTFALIGGPDPFSNTSRLRMPSSATYQKDRALEEVFRRALDGSSTVRKPRPSSERKQGAVDHWMNGVGDEGGASPPVEQPRSILEQLETKRRPRAMRSNTSNGLLRRTRSGTRSIMSDPDELPSYARKAPPAGSRGTARQSMDEPAEADDEFNSNDDEQEIITLQHGSDKENHTRPRAERSPSIRFHEPPLPSSVIRQSVPNAPHPPLPKSPNITSTSLSRHNRDTSAQTILFSPVIDESSEPTQQQVVPRSAKRRQNRPTTALKIIPSSPNSPPRQRQITRRPAPIRPRPAMPQRMGKTNKSTPNMSKLLSMGGSGVPQRRMPSYDAVALDLASDIGDNRHLDHGIGIMSSSFHTQMMQRGESSRLQNQDEDAGMMNRIMLSRMNNLEEGFKDILKEMRDWRNTGSRTASTGGEDSTSAQAVARAQRRIERKAQKAREASGKGILAEMEQASNNRGPTSLNRDDPFAEGQAKDA